jgi:hypothetical protein
MYLFFFECDQLNICFADLLFIVVDGVDGYGDTVSHECPINAATTGGRKRPSCASLRSWYLVDTLVSVAADVVHVSATHVHQTWTRPTVNPSHLTQS